MVVIDCGLPLLPLPSSEPSIRPLLEEFADNLQTCCGSKRESRRENREWEVLSAEERQRSGVGRKSRAAIQAKKSGRPFLKRADQLEILAVTFPGVRKKAGNY